MRKHYEEQFKSLVKEVNELGLVLEVAGMKEEIKKSIKDLENSLKGDEEKDYFMWDVVSCSLYDLAYAIADAKNLYVEILHDAYTENKIFDSSSHHDNDGYYFN